MVTALLNMTPRRVSCSPSDTSCVLNSLQKTNFSLGAEQFDGDSYLDRVIKKPWGHEYRIYADYFYDLWKLSILPGHMTSFHCHPRKETALLCLNGRGKMRFLNQEQTIQPLDSVYIERGVFHSTENIGDIPLELIEVEVPRNKLDLVRLDDKYGRSGKCYETQSLDYSMYILYQGQSIPGSKVRKACLDNTYRFDVRTGMDVLCRPVDRALFVVSLSIDKAVQHHAQVFSAPSFDPRHLTLDEFYFVISKTR
jgi:mannose-6-phosphate isomerase-like protein (cupin superfamily)